MQLSCWAWPLRCPLGLGSWWVTEGENLCISSQLGWVGCCTSQSSSSGLQVAWKLQPAFSPVLELGSWYGVQYPYGEEELNSCHQLGSSTHSSMYTCIQSLGLLWISGWQTLGSSPAPGSPCVLGLATMGVWGHGWRGRWTWSVWLLDWFFRFWGFWAFRGRCSNLLSLLGFWFILQEYSFFLQCWGDSLFIVGRSWKWSLHNLIPVQLHQECHTPLKILCCLAQDSERHSQPLSAQCWRADARGRVSSCLVRWKFLKLEESTQGRNSWWCSALRLQGVPNHQDASFWARGNLKAAVCHQANCSAWMLLRSSIKQPL